MEIQQAVGENVKRIRRARKMSIERAAAEAGVSRSMLGQLERGETNPSVGTLAKLAAAGRAPPQPGPVPPGLPHPPGGPAAHAGAGPGGAAVAAGVCPEDGGLQLVRELDTKPVRLDGGKVIKRPLLPFEEVSGLESYHVDVFISGKFSPDPLPVGTVAYLTVLSGTAGVTVGEESFQMLEWDAVRFPADQPWRVDNQSNAAVRVRRTYRDANPSGQTR